MKTELVGVVKRYGSTRALDHVSLSIDPGWIVALLGPNGAGKTTLLRCLAGLAAPDKGTVCYDGEVFSRGRLDLRRRLFFLPDAPLLFWERSVVRNIGVVQRVYEALPEDGGERTVGLLREFDLLPLARAPLASLSRGQAYKAALVGLLTVDPELWLLDEPFSSGMDPHGINALKRHVRGAVARGRTVIYSTQLLDVAERFADRVCVLHRGELRAFDRLENLRKESSADTSALEQLFQKLREGEE